MLNFIKGFPAPLIMRKLNATDHTHAVVLAIRRGRLNIGEVTDVPEDEMVNSR